MYLKLQTEAGKFTVIPLTDENVFSICPICGDEHQVDIDELVTVPGFEFSRHVCCPYCTKTIHEKGLTALMNERGKELAAILQGMKEGENDV